MLDEYGVLEFACRFTLTLDDLHAKHPARDLACRLRWRN